MEPASCDDGIYDEYDEEREIERLEHRFIETVTPYQREIRDKLLTSVAMIEIRIEQAIAWHFCKDVKMASSFVGILLRHLNGDRKNTIMKQLLKTFHPDLNNQIEKLLFAPLRDVTELRNAVAHSNFIVPDFSLSEYHSEEEHNEAFRDDGLTFRLRGKDESYSLEKLKSVTTKARGVVMLLGMLQIELMRRARGEDAKLLDHVFLHFANRFLSGKGVEVRKLTPPPITSEEN